MIKFKNKNTGEEVEEYSNSLYVTKNGERIPRRFVEESCDWEEVVEKIFQITKVINPNNIILTYDEVGKCIHRSDEHTVESTLPLGAVLQSLYRTSILEVKRLSDGEVFKVGDKATSGKYGTVDTIKSLRVTNDGTSIYVSTEKLSWGKQLENIVKVKPIYTTYDGVDRYEFQREHWVIEDTYAYYIPICSGHLSGTLSEVDTYKIFSTEEKALEYVKSVEPKPLFLTNDGVEIFEGSTYFCVNTAPHLWSLFEQTAGARTQLNKGVKAFSTEVLAKEYLLLHKPILSLDDLLSVWNIIRDDESYSSSPLFRSFKHLAEAKLNKK